MIHRIRAIHRIDPDNVGDLISPPTRYFDFGLPVEYLDISDPKAYQPDPEALTIFGGGGLMWWHEEMRVLLEIPGPKVIWGLGLNALLKPDRVDSYPDWMTKADLIGVRDFALDLPWVPGPSCMHQAFDRDDFTPHYPAVIYEHNLAEPIEAGDWPRLRTPKNLDEVVDFLASGNVVITNRYHGVYWSTLLKKKVLLYEPSCTRFSYFHDMPTLCDRKNWSEKMDQARAYLYALDECRKANTEFARKVRGLIEGEKPHATEAIQ